MSKRTSVGYIYFGVVLMTLLLRVSSALDVYSALGVEDPDAFFTCVVQLLIFGTMSISLYFLAVTRHGDGTLLSLARDFGVRKLSGRNVLRTLVLAFCMIVVSSAFSYMWQYILILIGYTHIPSSTDYSSIALLFKELALTALLPGIFEEVAHRGLIYAGYKDVGWKYVLVSALFFSLMHQNIVQTGYTFLDGIMLALVMYYTGSIFPSVIMHALNNAWVVVEGYTAQNGGILSFINVIDAFLSRTAAGIAVSIVCVIICAGLIVLMFYGMRKEAVKTGQISAVPFYSPEDGATVGRAVDPDAARPLRYDVPFIATVILGVAATLFSFVWGMMR